MSFLEEKLISSIVILQEECESWWWPSIMWWWSSSFDDDDDDDDDSHKHHHWFRVYSTWTRRFLIFWFPSGLGSCRKYWRRRSMWRVTFGDFHWSHLASSKKKRCPFGTKSFGKTCRSFTTQTPTFGERRFRGLNVSVLVSETFPKLGFMSSWNSSFACVWTQRC